MLLAYQLDKNLRGSRIYQSVFYMPVVIAPAIIGLITELVLSPTAGPDLSLFDDPRHGHVIDWLGNPKLNLWAVLVFACWRHASYVMILYLAGLKALDPTLREAAAIDGASESQAFFRVVLPALKPINIVLVVITVIEALRAFDIVYIINHGPERARAALRADHRQHHRRGEPHRLRLGDRGRAARRSRSSRS